MSEGGAPEWVRHAEADLRYAQLGCKESGILLNLAAFHAQQAIEKALKGLLVADEVEFPRTHDLEELLTILRQAGRHWPTELERVKGLTPLAVQTRYPGFDDPVEESEVAEAIRLASETLDWVRRELGLS